MEQTDLLNAKIHTVARADAHAGSCGGDEKAFEHEAAGTHFLLTLKGCRSPIIHDSEELKELTWRAAAATGATVLQIVAHRFQPQGTTVVAVLAESHASLHTYPESETVFWDCFTCGSTCKPELSEQVLADALSPSQVNKRLVTRE